MIRSRAPRRSALAALLTLQAVLAVAAGVRAGLIAASTDPLGPMAAMARVAPATMDRIGGGVRKNEAHGVVADCDSGGSAGGKGSEYDQPEALVAGGFGSAKDGACTVMALRVDARPRSRRQHRHNARAPPR